jgi:hypothetical protein
LFLSNLADPTSPEEGEITIDIEEIAKSTADKATKISAKETAMSVVEEARKALEELEKSSTNTSDPVQTDTEMVLVGADKSNPKNCPMAPSTQVLTDALTLVAPQ